MANKIQKLKFRRLGIILVIFIAAWFLGIFNGPIALYGDFFDPRSKFETPLKLKIQISTIPTNTTQTFQLHLRRKHGVYLHFVDEGGVPQNIAPARIQGTIIITSANRRKTLEIRLDPEKQYGYNPDPIKIFNYRLFGVEKNITVEVKDIRITSTVTDVKLKPIYFQIVVLGEQVFFH